MRGVLPMTALARAEGYRRVFAPVDDAAEAALVPVTATLDLSGVSIFVPTDFREVKGQEHVKRALEVAAAGGHNVIMTGPPGAGKTLLALALPSILPGMTIDEALDVTRVYSVADQLPAGTPLIQQRPFRAPHHTISHVDLV